MTPPSSVAAAEPQRPSPVLSAGEIIAASYRFVAGHAGAIAAALWLPTVLAIFVSLAALEGYFTMLARYLAAPNADFASVTVSIMVASYFVWLLLIVVGAARVTQLVENEGPRGWLDPAGMRLAARLYTAVLRFQLIVLLGAVALAALVVLLAGAFPGRPPGLRSIVSVLATLVFFAVISVRCGLTMPALAFHEKRSVLRRGWKLSRGVFWPLAAVKIVVTALPVIALQYLGEILIQRLINGAGLATLAAAAQTLATNDVALVSIAMTLTLSTTLFAVLTVTASSFVYRALSARR